MSEVGNDQDERTLRRWGGPLNPTHACAASWAIKAPAFGPKSEASVSVIRFSTPPRRGSGRQCPPQMMSTSHVRATKRCTAGGNRWNAAMKARSASGLGAMMCGKTGAGAGVLTAAYGTSGTP